MWGREENDVNAQIGERQKDRVRKLMIYQWNMACGRSFSVEKSAVRCKIMVGKDQATRAVVTASRLSVCASAAEE
jgi:hypothetical protein